MLFVVISYGRSLVRYEFPVFHFYILIAGFLLSSKLAVGTRGQYLSFVFNVAKKRFNSHPKFQGNL